MIYVLKIYLNSLDKSTGATPSVYSELLRNFNNSVYQDGAASASCGNPGTVSNSQGISF
jgi:hypothetical protein